MIPAMGTASIIQTSPPKYPAADTDNKTNRGWSPTDLPTIFGYMKLDSICCISKSPAIASTAAGKPPDDKAVVLKPLSPPEKAEIKVGEVTYREGDKVIQLTNMPDDNVYNGDIGIITRIVTRPNKEIYIDFDNNIVKYTPAVPFGYAACKSDKFSYTPFGEPPTRLLILLF